MPQMPAAGILVPFVGESAKQAVQFQLDPENIKPPTPTAQQRFRQSFQRETGRRFKHPGYEQDKIDQDKRFGRRTYDSLHVEDVLNPLNTDPLHQALEDQKNAVYASSWREPLGKHFGHRQSLPDSTRGKPGSYQPYVLNSEKNVPSFGRPTQYSESAGKLIFFNEEIPQVHAHSRNGVMAPDLTAMEQEKQVTRPLVRNYNWEVTGVNPDDFRFGRKNCYPNGAPGTGVASSLPHDTETKVVPRRQEQILSYSRNRLGRTREARDQLRNVGEVTFGVMNATDEWGARRTLQGEYPLEEQMPDKDLGTSRRKLMTREQIPEQPGRFYGVPSIRHDLKAPQLRQVCDPINYGDEPDSKGLLYPGRFASDGLGEKDFTLVREGDEVREVFRRIGEEFSDDTFAELADEAVRVFGSLSVDSFRHVLNKHRLNTTGSMYSTRPSRSGSGRRRSVH